MSVQMDVLIPRSQSYENSNSPPTTQINSYLVLRWWARNLIWNCAFTEQWNASKAFREELLDVDPGCCWSKNYFCPDWSPVRSNCEGLRNSLRPSFSHSLPQLMLWATTIQLPVQWDKLDVQMGSSWHLCGILFLRWLFREVRNTAIYDWTPRINHISFPGWCSVLLVDGEVPSMWSAAIRWTCILVDLALWSAAVAVVGCANANICDDVFDCFLFIFAQCHLPFVSLQWGGGRRE